MTMPWLESDSAVDGERARHGWATMPPARTINHQRLPTGCHAIAGAIAGRMQGTENWRKGYCAHHLKMFVWSVITSFVVVTAHFCNHMRWNVR